MSRSIEQFAAPPIDYPFMDREVRDVMTPGVVTIADDASLHEVARAFGTHRVHALLVVSRGEARPMGWVTTRGMLRWLDGDKDLHRALDAVSDGAVQIDPSATVRSALRMLRGEGVPRLLVQGPGDRVPEGVISDFDLSVECAR